MYLTTSITFIDINNLILAWMPILPIISPFGIDGNSFILLLLSWKIFLLVDHNLCLYLIVSHNLCWPLPLTLMQRIYRCLVACKSILSVGFIISLTTITWNFLFCINKVETIIEWMPLQMAHYSSSRLKIFPKLKLLHTIYKWCFKYAQYHHYNTLFWEHCERILLREHFIRKIWYGWENVLLWALFDIKNCSIFCWHYDSGVVLDGNSLRW